MRIITRKVISKNGENVGSGWSKELVDTSRRDTLHQSCAESRRFSATCMSRRCNGSVTLFLLCTMQQDYLFIFSNSQFASTTGHVSLWAEPVRSICFMSLLRVFFLSAFSTFFFFMKGVQLRGTLEKEKEERKVCNRATKEDGRMNPIPQPILIYCDSMVSHSMESYKY